MVSVRFVRNASLVRNCGELLGALESNFDRALAIRTEECKLMPRERTEGSRLRRYDTGHAAGMSVLRFSCLPGARHGISQIEPFHRVCEIAHEVSPAQLTVGEDIEPELLLFRQDAQNVAILHFSQGLGVRSAACFKQFGGPEETSDFVSSIGSRHIFAFPSIQLDPELFVQLQSMLAAVAYVVIDEPEDVQRLGQRIVIVVEFEGPVQPEKSFHSVRIIRYERVNAAGTFVDVAARARYPVIFQITPAAFESACEYRAAMAMASELPAFFHPEDICERAAADVEGEMANVDILDEWNPRRFVLARADVDIRACIFANYVGDARIRVDGHGSVLLNGLEAIKAQFRSFKAQDASIKTENAIAPLSE